jgi:hypothetical protein
MATRRHALADAAQQRTVETNSTLNVADRHDHAEQVWHL